tara:strand:+ start:7124 stop:7567 length:444 start_codon:yes stop_codon:yes gene_type:complete
MKELRISKVRSVKTPNRGTKESAGIDFYIPNDFLHCTVKPGQSLLIPSGIKANIPKGHMLQVCNKSGVAIKGLIVGACIVDSDYQGEIHINIWNVSNKDVEIEPGRKIVQMILIPIELPTIVQMRDVDLFNEKSDRGAGGFGSTGLD